MKKLLLILALVFAAQGTVQASHVLGGEIRWECLGNGRFIFFAKVFRDCTGINLPFQNQTLTIQGNPLPRSATNSPINSITLRPDSNTWINNRFGDTSPTCKPNGDPITCGNGDPGAVQQFFYVSSPIQLRGTPPSGGWTFWMASLPCCRPNVTNLATSGTMMLRAIMYPDANNSTVDQCKDSSPEFLALPVNSICRGYEFTYNHTAIDKDLDSLVYGWDRTYNTPPNAPQPVPYANGFAFSNPTPDKTFSTQNIPSTLDPITGIIKVGVWSGSPQTRNYLTVVRVDAWRQGRVIASVFREIPFSFFDCPRLPNGQINRPPEIFLDGDSAEGLVENIVAGQEIRIPFQATDLDFSSGVPGLQQITVEPAGFMFSQNLQTPSFCLYDAPPGETESCAFLRNQDPTFNAIAEPSRWEITGFAGIATEFVWGTRCHHVAEVTGTGVPGQNFGIFNFVMRTYDDHCPIPGINYPTITVRVRDPFPLEQPIMKGVSVNLDGSIAYQWAPPIDSTTNFFKYEVEFNQPNNNIPPNPNFWQMLNDNERRYKQDRRLFGLNTYLQKPTGVPNDFDIFNPIPNRDWYVRMYAVSGCRRDVNSAFSAPARVMELDVTPSGNQPQAPLRSEATLSWNRAKPISSFNHPYYVYVSPTRYYIYTNDAVTFGATPGVYSGHDDPNNWLLRGNTYLTNFEVGTTTCSGKVAFRVEARDTIITWKQGTAPRQDTLDTLTFSTFSMVDSLFMVNPGFIPDPLFDTVEVRENGDIFLRVNAGAAGTTGEFRLFDGTIAPANLLGKIFKPNDSIVLTGLNGQVNPQNIIIEGLDECDSNVRANSNVYQTFIPTGTLPADPCAGIYELNWINPTGFPGNTRGYRIYRRRKATNDPNYSPWELIRTVSGGGTTTANIPIASNTDFIFKVVAFDRNNAVIISAEHQVSIGNTRTYEIVPPPELRCSYVYDDGTVGLTFLPSSVARGLDTTNNWTSYKFQYREAGGTWTDVPAAITLAQDDDSLFIGGISGIDAIANSYQFRATSLSGCSGFEEGPYANINLIEPSATAIAGDSNKRVSITWTGTGISSNTPELVRKSFGLTNYFAGGAIDLVNDDEANETIDDANSTICDTIGNYFITKTDQLTGCVNRSRPDTARIIDQFPPPPQLIDFVSYRMDSLIGNVGIPNPPGPPIAVGVFSILGDINIAWSDQPSEDIDQLLIFSPDENNGQNDSLDQVNWDVFTATIQNSVKNASNQVFTWSAQSIDACGRKANNFEDFDYHKNMVVDVDFTECDSSMNISWNSYDYFQSNAQVEYVIQRLFPATQAGVLVGFLDPVDFVNEEGTTTDTTFSVTVDQDSVLYAYRVIARPIGSNGIQARSSWDTARARFGAVPAFNYLSNVDVRPSRDISLNLYRDTTIEIAGMRIWRGQEPGVLAPYRRIDGDPDTAIVDLFDANVDIDERPYYYQIVIENECGNPIDTSNAGNSIHLRVEANNEALTNVLRWNQYEGWDSTVAFYNIYRGVNGESANELYTTVPAGDESEMMFVDDVYDNIYSVGNYCYRVEAVQSVVNPQFAAVIAPATSNSNNVCVTQDPLFYIPNAFTPDGVNQTFGPSGQFFDYTLYEMMIYNRWGELIYESRDIAKGWDGTINGEDAALGSYVYTIRFVDGDGNEHRRKGTVTLIR